jgi:hypothetical protein
MLWKEPGLTRSQKTRWRVYAVLIPFLISVAWMVYELDVAQKTIQAAGGGY